MKIIKISLLIGCLSCTSVTYACEKWQFIITAESPLTSTTVESEYITNQLSLKKISEQSYIKDEHHYNEQATTLNLTITDTDKHSITYDISANIPVLNDNTIEHKEINIGDSATLHDGYLNYHQRYGIKITLYGQRLACML